MENFISPLLFSMVLLMYLWFYNARYRFQEARAEQQIAHPLPLISR
ncbi:hypothetical protein [Dictyobacter kobayashii]|nr:hypothetical protein [Dictyobacter kobayashii]